MSGERIPCRCRICSAAFLVDGPDPYGRWPKLCPKHDKQYRTPR